MNRRIFGLLYRNEIRLLLRDRRTLVLAILVPALVMPVMLLASRYSNRQRERSLEDTTYRYAVTGPDGDRVRSILKSAIAGNRSFKIAETPTDDPDKALETSAIQFYLRTEDLPSGGHSGGHRGGKITVVYRASVDASNSGGQRMLDLLEQARQEKAGAALVDRGFAGDPAHWMPLESKSLATRGQASGLTAGRFITAILFVLMLTGGSVVALDIVAGEKERGTLETLLTTAAGRSEIVLAKQFAISTVALVITLIQALNFFIYLKLKIVALPADFALQLSSGMALTLLALFLPLSIAIGSVLLILSAYAKSYKEAHNYFFPVYLLGLLLSLASLLPGTPLRSAIVLLPIANVSIAAREILVGRPDLPMIAVTFAVMLGFAAWLLRTAMRTLAREDIVLPALADPVEFTGGPGLFGKRVLRWFALIWAVQFAAAANVPQLAALRRQILFNEIVLLLGASLLMIRYYSLDLKATLSLRPVKPAVWLAILCAIPTAGSAAESIFRVMNLFIPVSEELIRQSSANLIPPGMPQWQLFLFLAVVPALCEEIAFRGLLLSGLRKRLRPIPLSIAVGLVFGLFHMTLFRIAPTAALGIILTGIAVMTGSIFPGMLLHMGNNAWGVWAGQHGLDSYGSGIWRPAAMMFIFALSIWVIYRNRVQPDTPHTGSSAVRQIR